VMHGMHDETDMQKMGGLLRRMPITGVTFLIGGLALSGLPPLAGFFAKDQILEIANHTGHQWVYLLGTLGAVVTALYIGRLMFMTFFGQARTERADEAHESSAILWVPLVLLSVGAAAAGLLNPGADGPFTRWLESVVGGVPLATGGLPVLGLDVIAGVLATATLVIAWLVYGSGRVDWLALRQRLQPIPRLFANGWYVDDAYSALLVAPGKAVAAYVAYTVDVGLIDGFANALGAGTRRLASVGRRIQTGFVRSYALALFVGSVALLVYVGLRL
jgi:NADH-quinone oxidoreductase subunit L